jgi:hypothetical protein
VSGKSSTENELLLQALDASVYREAEVLFVRWVMHADLPAAAEIASALTEQQARRAGHAVSTAIRAKLLAKSEADPFLRLLRDKLSIADSPLLKDTWQPDLAFEPQRLKQRVLEQQRKATHAH